MRIVAFPAETFEAENRLHVLAGQATQVACNDDLFDDFFLLISSRCRNACDQRQSRKQERGKSTQEGAVVLHHVSVPQIYIYILMPPRQRWSLVQAR